jgi:soluble lytic murein transglycosylase-like protein
MDQSAYGFKPTEFEITNFGLEYRKNMVCSRKVICLFVLFSLSASMNNLWASSLGDKLAMLGYSDEEIANVVSGKRYFNAIQLKFKLEMLGYDNTRPSPMRSVLRLDLRATPDVHKNLNEKAKSYFGIIADAAEKTNLEKSLLLAVIKIESDFDANALSPKGAMGLMQLMPGTANDLGLVNPFDPAQNIHGGAKYLANCINKFMDLRLGLAAYNAGPNLVARLNRIPSIKETQNYVKNVMKYIEIYSRLNLSN